LSVKAWWGKQSCSIPPSYCLTICVESTRKSRSFPKNISKLAWLFIYLSPDILEKRKILRLVSKPSGFSSFCI
jgi:hypothetical protein